MPSRLWPASPGSTTRAEADLATAQPEPKVIKRRAVFLARAHARKSARLPEAYKVRTLAYVKTSLVASLATAGSRGRLRLQLPAGRTVLERAATGGRWVKGVQRALASNELCRSFRPR